MHLLKQALCSLCFLIPAMSFGQTYSPFNFQRVSPAAMQFIEGGLLLARQALNEANAIAVSDAKQRGLLSEKCHFEHRDIHGLSIQFARCPSPNTVIVEVIADSATLPPGIKYGMNPTEVAAQLGAPSADAAKVAESQGLTSVWKEGSTDLVYLADPESPSTWLVELQFEQLKLTRVRWTFGL